MNHHTEEYLKEKLIQEAHTEVSNPIRYPPITSPLTYHVNERAGKNQNQQRSRYESDQKQILREDRLVAAKKE